MGDSAWRFFTLTKDGTVYFKQYDGEFTKIMDNVKDIQGSYFIDKQDVVYLWNTKGIVKMAPKLQINLQKDIANTVLLENNTISYYAGTGVKFDKDDPKIEQLYNHYPKDIKQVLFVNYPGDSKEDRVINLKLVYVNTKMKLFCTECTMFMTQKEQWMSIQKCQGV